MRKAPQKRGPSVKACVKRLTGITLSELETLSSRDLNNILRVGSIFTVIMGTLKQRQFNSTQATAEEFVNAA